MPDTELECRHTLARFYSGPAGAGVGSVAVADPVPVPIAVANRRVGGLVGGPRPGYPKRERKDSISASKSITMAAPDRPRSSSYARRSA